MISLIVLPPDELGAFEDYLPAHLPEAKNHVRVYLGFYEEDLALGAAVVDIGETVLEIVCLNYDESVIPGSCEDALMAHLEQNLDKTSIEEVIMRAQGTSEELKQQDMLMLTVGFFAMPITLTQFHTTLGQLLDSEAFRNMEQWDASCSARPVAEAEDFLLRQYNAAHQAMAIHSGDYDENTSFCFVDDNTIKAVILTHQKEGVLYVDWLASDSGKPHVPVVLIRDAVTAAQKLYPPETELVLACDAGSVRSLAEQLSFVPQTELEGRLYKHYVN